MKLVGDKDGALLKRWQQGDRAAAEELIDRYSDSLHWFFSTKIGDNVEDLIQQVFLALLENAARFEGRASLKTFVFSIARRKLYNHYRERNRHPGVDTTQPSLADLRTTPSAAVARRQAHQQLYLALETLPVDQQIALELLYWEQMPPREIAAVLETSENTVYTRIRRARERLREALQDLSPTPVDVHALMHQSNPI